MEKSSDGSRLLPSWLSSDLHKLQDDDVTKQLEVILGEQAAEQILNPTVEDELNTGDELQPVISKHETQGAHVLWSSLRDTSKKKLARQTSADNMLSNSEYVVHNINSNNNINGKFTNRTSSHRVDLYRQRFQLMHKVAHLNEQKTKQLLETVKLPALADVADAEYAYQQRPRMFDEFSIGCHGNNPMQVHFLNMIICQAGCFYSLQ